MNARQKVKKLKKQINALQEIYNVYKKPVFITHTTMQFQEFRAKRVIPPYMIDVKGVMDYEKQAVAKDLFEEIKEHIIYEENTEGLTPTITASIFISESEE